ncbi:MAG TPA: CUAEP/CCAEP-tail radical SAM protein [Vicinamibacterales bacterium]|nr:CUAEP/CCAEP-tail radical SAM protein [Vicinamibacterales bacterium]
MSVLLLSTYDLGRQPFGLASPAAWLKRAGFDVLTRDLSRDKLQDDDVRGAALVAFYLPMHTATRLALPVIDRVRQINPTARLAAYGLYAPLSEGLLRARGVTEVLGPEAEAALAELALILRRDTAPAAHRPSSVEGGFAAGPASTQLPRLTFLVPDRSGLPHVGRYASLQMPDGSHRVVGATDATRGCKHRCRHCPIVPIYDGHFRVVSSDVVLADIEQQAAAGAEHITFGDPDFFNGPAHARRIVEALHARHPSLTYDVTVKIEHLLKHDGLLPVLARTGCLFVTSAVESLDDEVLGKLQKGHTRADFLEALRLCRAAGVSLVPTFVAFTPWTTLDSYRDLLAAVHALDLVEHVSPVQWGLRLLITEGSRLLELEDIRRRVESFDSQTLTYPWRHEDPRVDALQAGIVRAVGVKLTRSRGEVFAAACELAGLNRAQFAQGAVRDRATIPYLNEPWYC